MNYPGTIEHKIGFDAVRRLVSDKCLSDLGKTKCAEMSFSTDFSYISSRLREVAEMCAILASGEDFPLNSVHDLTPQLKGIRAAGTHIAENDLVRLRASLQTLTAIASFFKAHRHEEGTPYPALDFLADGIDSFPAILAEIDRVIDKFGWVKDNASPELAGIRSRLASMAGAVNAAMRRVIANAVRDGLIDADTTPSVRDGRPVIPVPPMNKRRIPGIVHDESASGKTYYIEPAEVVEAGNRMRELEIEERREVLRILVALADMLRPHVPELLDAYDILGEFDFINAKARFAADCGGMMPSLHDGMELEWYHACHPILKLSLESHGKSIVPLDITLTPNERLLIISGPNAGGKSVTLKTVAVVQYMMQCGLLPPVYENSHMGVVDGIYIDIGDDQSMEDDLSTYSSHLKNMKFFLAHADARSLVLIDEFGSGTEPLIGGAIAQAVLAQLVDNGVWGVITTHFQNLKHFADETEGLVNGSMLYDRQLMQPLFRLSIGNPGSSFAIEIARKIGLPSAIIDAASEIVGTDYIKLDHYLLDIARDKRYWENKRMAIRQKEKKIDELMERYENDAEQLRLRRREIIEDARSQADRILSESNAAIERTIHSIKEANAEKEKTLEARRQLAETRRQLEGATEAEHPMLKRRKGKRRKEGEQSATTAKPNPQAPLAVGDNVLLDGSGTVGKILEIEGRNATVAFGMLKTQVKLSRLQHTIRQVQSGAQKGASLISQQTTEANRERQLNFSTEIDVRGMRVDEALQAVTYFIDDAVQFNASTLRILHGTGTGALRQAIRQYLDTVPSVSSYRDEDVRFGGAGITVVSID